MKYKQKCLFFGVFFIDKLQLLNENDSW